MSAMGNSDVEVGGRRERVGTAADEPLEHDEAADGEKKQKGRKRNPRDLEPLVLETPVEDKKLN